MSRREDVVRVLIDGARDVDWAGVEMLLRVAMSAGSGGDGYASSTPGNGSPGGGQGGGRLMGVRYVDEESGRVEVDLVPTSSTEAAAIDRAHVSDAVHHLGAEMLVCLKALGRVPGLLARFERLRSISDVPEPPMCWVAREMGMAWDPLWVQWRQTTFAGQLEEAWPEPRWVSNYVYWFVRNHKRMPDREEMTVQLQRSVQG